MQRQETLLVILVILLVWVALAAAPLSPQPLALKTAGAQLEQAQAQNLPESEALALRRMLVFQPWRDELWLDIGRLELKTGNLEEGIRALETFRGTEKLPAQDWLALVEAYRANGQIELARQELAALAASGEMSADGYRSILYLAMNDDDLEAARQYAQQWLEAFPQDAAAMYWHGLLNVLDQPAAAQNWLKRAAELNPIYQPAAQSMDEAVRLALANDEPSYRFLVIGRALGALEEWPLAEEAFERAVQAAPGYAEAWALLGQAQTRLGKDGLAALNTAENLNPHSVIVRTSLGLYWREAAQPEKALFYFQGLAEQEMGNCIWQVELGRTYEQMGALDTALALFSHAVEVEPDSLNCWRELALFSLKQNLEVVETGLPAARQVLRIEPQEAASQDLMGWALLVQKDVTNAEKFFKKALEIQENYLPAHIHIAQLYLLQGDPSGLAAGHLYRVIEISPGSAYAAAAQKLIEEYHLP